MKPTINFDEKTTAALLYVVSKLGKEKSEMHSIFKALYFADRKHLANYGRMIINDKYIAMDNGPVPSLIYDGCKKSRSSGENFCDMFIMNGRMHIQALKDPDLDELSSSDIECLDAGITEVKNMNYAERTKNSHDSAYNNAWEIKPNSPISVIEIAKAGGAHDEIIQFLSGNFA
jgi:uncharacterized phage-associated protein